ncbi:MAG: hypothetical protein JXN60_01565 [Lentisphaerae bacterium]|nr:hypothetical protein [Lentisphaerota bacterium]
MKSFGLMKDLLCTYVALSGEGTRFIRRLKRMTKGRESSRLKQFMFSEEQRAATLRMLIRCDRCFSEVIDKDTCNLIKRDRSAVYGRMIPFAWATLGFHCRILDAFGIAHDAAAEERSVFTAFAHREWNDLIDEYGFSFRDIYRASETQEEIPHQLILVKKLRQKQKKIAPPEKFAKYCEHLKNYQELAPLTVRDNAELAERVVSEGALYIARAHVYLMVKDVPRELEEVLVPVSKWFSSLDELTDIESDQTSRRITFMSLVSDPEEEIWKQCRNCVDAFRQLAPHPEKMIDFIEITTRSVVNGRGDILDIEKRLATAS